MALSGGLDAPFALRLTIIRFRWRSQWADGWVKSGDAAGSRVYRRAALKGGCSAIARPTKVYTGFKMRTSWVEKTVVRCCPDAEMHYARKGLITEEMEYISRIEKVSADLIRAEVARGRMIIPANIRHTNLEPMARSGSSRSARSTRISGIRQLRRTSTRNLRSCGIR